MKIYDFSKHENIYKTNDVIIDSFIKWIIFNPLLFCVISHSIIITLIQIILFLVLPNSSIGIVFYILVSITSFMMIILNMNTKIGEKLCIEKKYMFSDMNKYNLPKSKLTYYQVKYILSFQEEFEEI